MAYRFITKETELLKIFLKTFYQGRGENKYLEKDKKQKYVLYVTVTLNNCDPQ